MKNIERFVLCNNTNNAIEKFVDAQISNNQLTVSGKEYYKKAISDMDYQYCFRFDERNTNKVFEIINLNEFKKLFSGDNGCNNLRSFCIAYDIHFSFDCY